MANQWIPNIDYSKIANLDDLRGLWIVVRVTGRQQLLGQGETPTTAMEQAAREHGVSRDDNDVVLAKVPTPTALVFVGGTSE